MASDPFDFDKWLTKHKLNNAKQILVDHNMNVKSNLNFTCTHFSALMGDIRVLSKPVTRSKIVSAIQSVVKETEKEKEKQMKKELKKYKKIEKDQVIIYNPSKSEKETIKEINKYINNLHKLQNEFKQINKEYNKKKNQNNNIIDKYKQISTNEINKIQNKITQNINLLDKTLKNKDNNLINSINLYTNNVNKIKIDNDNNVKQLNKVMINIDKIVKNEISYFNDRYKECEAIMLKKHKNNLSSNINIETEKQIKDIGNKLEIYYKNKIDKIKAYQTLINTFIETDLKLLKTNVVGDDNVVDDDEKKGSGVGAGFDEYDPEFDDKYLYNECLKIDQNVYNNLKANIDRFMALKSRNNNDDNSNNNNNKFVSLSASDKEKIFLLKKQKKINKSKRKSLKSRVQILEYENQQKTERIQSLQRKISINTQQHEARKQHVRKEFGDCNLNQWSLSDDKSTISGICVDKSCNNSLIYAKSPVVFNNNGMYLWSVKQLNQLGNIRNIGITSQKIDVYDSNYKFHPFPSNQYDAFSYFNGSNHPYWKPNEIITVILDCFKWNVSYYKTDKNGESSLIKTDDVDSKYYYFALVADPTKLYSPKYKIIKTPKSVIAAVFSNELKNAMLITVTPGGPQNMDFGAQPHVSGLDIVDDHSGSSSVKKYSKRKPHRGKQIPKKRRNNSNKPAKLKLKKKRSQSLGKFMYMNVFSENT